MVATAYTSGLGLRRGIGRAARALKLREPREPRDRTGEIGVHTFAHGRMKVDRSALLNHLGTVHGYRSYLEIGVRRRSNNLDRILAPEKVGVDPDPKAKADYVMTSDAFFEAERERRFDLIFIDGLHTGEQVERDIANALAALAPGGAIMLHDLNPPTALHAREDQEVDGRFPAWNGTSWRGFVAHRATRPDLEMYVVDADWGCGFVRPSRQKLWQGPWETYEDLARNRKRMLNLISVRKFLRRHLSR